MAITNQEFGLSQTELGTTFESIRLDGIKGLSTPSIFAAGATTVMGGLLSGT